MKKNIVLCDIDGTIANNDHRQHFLEGKKDWDGFFGELINDSPIMPVIEKINQEVNNGNKIIFITGRPERYRYSTNLWLKENIPFNYDLYMRKDKDKRNKLVVKKDIYEEHLKQLNIILCIDNDDALNAQWKDLGLNVLDAKTIVFN